MKSSNELKPYQQSFLAASMLCLCIGLGTALVLAAMKWPHVVLPTIGAVLTFLFLWGISHVILES